MRESEDSNDVPMDREFEPDTILARYEYPLPDGTAYYAKDLETPKDVEGIFDYCQILLAVIFPAGWRFLFKRYGFEGLYQINERSGWLDGDTKQEIFEDFIYHSHISGYDPITDKYGEYNDKFYTTPDAFLPEDGSKYAGGLKIQESGIFVPLEDTFDLED